MLAHGSGTLTQVSSGYGHLHSGQHQENLLPLLKPPYPRLIPCFEFSQVPALPHQSLLI